MEQYIVTKLKLENELKNFNHKLKKIAYENNVRLINKSAFIIDLKNQRGNAEVFSLVACFINDDGYLKKIDSYCEGEFKSGDIGRYIFLRNTLKQFCRKFAYIQTSCSKKLKSENALKIDIYDLVKDIYEKNNIFQSMKLEEITVGKEEIYFLDCIEEEIKRGTIDIKKYMERDSFGTKCSSFYLKNIVQSMFHVSEIEEVNKIELLSMFYKTLRNKMKIEINREYMYEIVLYFNSVINLNIEEIFHKW